MSLGYNTIVARDGNTVHMVPHPMFDGLSDIRVLPPFETINGMEQVVIKVTEQFYDELLKTGRKNVDKEITNIDGSFVLLGHREEEDFFEDVYSILIQRKSEPGVPHLPITIADLRITSTGYWAAMMSKGVMVLDPKQ